MSARKADPEFERHRTALRRHELSRPVRLLLADGLLADDDSLFDYGCGHGGDVRRLGRMGIVATGWDPVHAPQAERRSAEVVNLGYVVNVVEAAGERAEVLRSAWSLARKCLVVSARLRGEMAETKPASTFADGIVTQRGTFQKFYEQEELRDWIKTTLGVSPIAAAPGIFYIFREASERANFLAARYRRAPSRLQLGRLDELVASDPDLFDRLAQFVQERGRAPDEVEWEDFGRVIDAAGTMNRAMRALRNSISTGAIEEVRLARSEDLKLFLALSRFEGRPDFHELDHSMQRDVKSFFGSYRQACADADQALALLGDSTIRDMSLAQSPVGKLLPGALYLHVEALRSAGLTIRLYEGCARQFIGTVEDSNIVKLCRGEPRVSFLTYPDFDSDPHPALLASTSVRLQTFQVRDRRFDRSPNPPILHRKEAFLDAEHPRHEKFARLTQQEEARGLYNDLSRIGTRDGWNTVLHENGLGHKGHRLVKVSKRDIV